MKKNLMFLAVALAGLASCNGGFKKGDSGLLYDIIEDKSGPLIQPKDFVSLNLIAKTDADSVMYSTYDVGRPAVMSMPEKIANKGDLYSALVMMSEGDSAVIKVNADSLFKKNARPPGFKGKYIVYQIKVNKVIPKGTLSDQIFSAKVEDYFKVESTKAKAAEPAKIAKYIKDKNLTLTKTDSGLYYQITKPGSGPLPVKGDTVLVNYTGRFLNGKVFDTSIKEVAQKEKTFNPMAPYKPAPIPVGVGRVIPGWDQALLLLNKGSKATLVIPSNLGYGERGMQAIPPFTPLTFEIEVLDIIKPNPNAPKSMVPPMPGAAPQVQK